MTFVTVIGQLLAWLTLDAMNCSVRRLTTRPAHCHHHGSAKRACLFSRFALMVSLIAIESRAAELTFRADTDYLMDTWEIEEGLPENSATAIVQTLDGYLWFGTFNGLVRFNGAGFTVFHPENTPQLPSAGIVNLYRDGRGWMWVSTYGGLAVHDREQWRQLRQEDGWTGDYVRTFAERANGDMLLTTFNGKLFEFSGGKFTDLPTPPGEAGQGYFGGVDEDGQWWAVQHKFIGRWDDGRWGAMIEPPDLPDDAFGCGPARDGGMWLAMGNELRKLRRGVEVARVTLPNRLGGIWSLTEDSRGNVWIATYNRGFCQVTSSGAVRWWDATNGASDNGRCVFEDREGNLWLGSSGDGLLRFKPRRFQHFELVTGRKGIGVRSVSADLEGGVWAASYGLGLFHISDAGVTNAVLSSPTHQVAYLQSVLADRAARLWIGTLGHAVHLLDQNVGLHVPAAQTGGGNVLALFEDSRGRVWISGGSGIAMSEGTNFQAFGPSDGLPAGAVTSFEEDIHGAIWLSNDGVVFRRTENQSFVIVNDEQGEPIRNIACLKADADGSMWLGTSDRGLLRWKNGRLARIAAEVGFPVTAVQGVLADNEGFFWMTSGRRIVRAGRADLHKAAEGRAGRLDCHVFDASDGLPSADFSIGRQPTCARDTQGRLWFATTKGVVRIDPAELRLNDTPPPVYVERISFQHPDAAGARDRVGLESGMAIRTYQSGPFDEAVTLPAGSSRLEIEYAALSFSAPEKVRFQIKLEGVSRDWEDVQSQRNARFYELRPGAYTFRVRASNNDGVWNETGAALAFTVLPRYWQTWWFRLGVALLLVNFGGTTAWWQSRTKVRRALERERMANEIRHLAGRLINAQEEERRRIARELHDDFSQRLALLSVEMELFRSPSAGGAESVPELSEMATRVKDLSTEVHRMAYELHPAKLDQLGLVSTVRGFCRELSRQSGVRIDFEPGVFPRNLSADLALCFYRVIQESLQNVVRHSGAKEARVELRAEQDRVCLVVADSGRGFDVEQGRREGGLGLSSMRERIRLIHGQLTVRSMPGKGTRIEVCAPLLNPGTAG